MSLWRKRKTSDTVATEHDNLPSPLDRLHQENVRLGLYEIVYDLSIKSDDLSIKSWMGLTPEEIDEIIENSIDKVDALIQTMDKLKDKNT